MSFGTKIQNASGDVVIDGSYRNYYVDSVIPFSGSITSSNYPTYKTVSFNRAMDAMPLVGIQCSNVSLAAYSSVTNGSSVFYPGDKFTGVRIAPQLGGGSYSGKLLVMTPTTNVNPSGTHGMIVRDASGNKVFDSRLPYARLVAAIEVPWLGGENEYVDLTHPYAANPFYVLPTTRILRRNSQRMLGTRRISSTVCRVTSQLLYRIGSVTLETWHNPVRLLVFDYAG